MSRRTIVVIGLVLANCCPAAIERVWLTQRNNEPTGVVVNWETSEPGNSIVRFGLTRQACHSYKKGSEQYEWYRNLIAEARPSFIVTLYNEKNSSVRLAEGSSWRQMFSKGTLCISGFGHFGEVATDGPVTYYNTSLTGTGDKYADPKSAALMGEDNYVLMNFVNKTKELIVDLKRLDGSVLRTAHYPNGIARQSDAQSRRSNSR